MRSERRERSIGLKTDAVPFAEAHPSSATFRLCSSFSPRPPFHTAVLEVRQIVNLTAIFTLPAVLARTVEKPLFRPDGHICALHGAHDATPLCRALEAGLLPTSRFYYARNYVRMP